MNNDIIDNVRQSFSVQAAEFENSSMSFSKQEYLDYVVNSIDFHKEDTVLEVASGTCACGRAIAPNVLSVTCTDATPAMLEVGKCVAEKDGMTNISFIEALAQKLPFENNSFDVVITRLSFHHFENMEKPFAEMKRVLKAGGKLVIIDMEATSDEFRETQNEIETMRDFSHIQNRSKAEFESLFLNNSFELIRCETTPIKVELSSWLQLTNTSDEIQNKIAEIMEADLNSGANTGFSPYKENGQICFNQQWLFMIGIKE